MQRETAFQKAFCALGATSRSSLGGGEGPALLLYLLREGEKRFVRSCVLRQFFRETQKSALVKSFVFGFLHLALGGFYVILCRDEQDRLGAETGLKVLHSVVVTSSAKLQVRPILLKKIFLVIFFNNHLTTYETTHCR